MLRKYGTDASKPTLPSAFDPHHLIAVLVGLLETTGSLDMATRALESLDKTLIFRRLLWWGVSMSVAGAVLAFVFLDLS